MALGIVLIISGCGAAKDGQVSVGDMATGKQVVANQVMIIAYAFSPAVLNIKKGETVTWTNDDSVPHAIKFAALSSENLNDGDSFSFTFTNAGTFDYYCSLHPSMAGKIIVE